MGGQTNGGTLLSHSEEDNFMAATSSSENCPSNSKSDTISYSAAKGMLEPTGSGCVMSENTSIEEVMGKINTNIEEVMGKISEESLADMNRDMVNKVPTLSQKRK